MTAAHNSFPAGFLRAYWVWIAALILVDAAVFIGMECVWRESSLPDPWATRMDLAAALLLFDNLCVLWWYAWLTRRLVDNGEQQHALQRQQLEQATKEFAESQRQLLVSLKPDVFAERVEDAEYGHATYVAHNTGGGPAINVYYLGWEELGRLSQPVAIGSLTASEERRLPRQIRGNLERGGTMKFVLLAEAHFTRTRQWNVTLNVRTQEAGTHGGQVIHRAADVADQPLRDDRLSLTDYLNRNREQLARQLREFGTEVGE